MFDKKDGLSLLIDRSREWVQEHRRALWRWVHRYASAPFSMWWRVYCAKCNNVGPWARSQTEARERVEVLGWVLLPKGELSEAALCAGCYPRYWICAGPREDAACPAHRWTEAHIAAGSGWVQDNEGYTMCRECNAAWRASVEAERSS